MIRYILVDDEPKTLERVQKKINTIAKDYNLKHIASYNNPITALAEIKEKEYDLLIVDFEMPNCNGVELAKSVATNKKIIFLTSTTNNEQMVINTLDISGYLSKPFDIDEFKTVIKNKVIGKINATNTSYKKGDLVTISISINKDISVYPEEVFYISSAKISTAKKITEKGYEKVSKPKDNNVNFYGKNDMLLHENVRVNINQLVEKFRDFNFEKITQSTIVNKNHIFHRDNRNLKLRDCKHPFEISEKQKKHFLNTLKYVFSFK